MTTHPSPVLYQRRSSRWAHLICVIAALLLTLALLVAAFEGFGDLDPLFSSPDIGWDMKVALTLAIMGGVFMTFVFAYRLAKNPVVLTVYEDGFEYIPAGISTGLIKFSDVLELRDEGVVTSIVDRSGGVRGVTAVVLRDPAEYTRRFPAGLRHLMEARGKMNSSPILIVRGEFGAEHDRILAMLRERVAKAGGGANL